MSFLSTQSLVAALQAGGVAPFDANRVQHGAYELAVGREMILTSGAGKIDLSDGKQVPIPPGQLATVLTAEVVDIPKDHIGFISLRSGKKKTGLINVSGFHVDPGYKGNIAFTLYNAGVREVFIQQGDVIFSMWLSKLDHVDSKPYLKDGISSITTELASSYHREWPSPPVLEKQIQEIEKSQTWTKGLAVTSFFVIISSVLINKFDNSLTKDDIRTITQTSFQDAEKTLASSIAQKMDTAFLERQKGLEAALEKRMTDFKNQWMNRSVAKQGKKTNQNTK